MCCTEFKGRTENGAQPDITAFFAQTVDIDRYVTLPEISPSPNVTAT